MNQRRIQRMFLVSKIKKNNPVPLFQPAPPVPPLAPTKPPDRIQGEESSRSCKDSEDDCLPSFLTREKKVLNEEWMNTWIQQQRDLRPCSSTVAPSGNAPAAAAAASIPKLVVYSSSPSSMGSRLSRQSLRSVSLPQQPSKKVIGPQHSKSTTAGEVTNGDHPSDERDVNAEKKGKISTKPVKSIVRSPITSLITVPSRQNSGIKRTRSRSKGSDSKTTSAAEVPHIDHTSDSRNENPGITKSILKSPNARTTNALSEQNKGGKSCDNLRPQLALSVKRSLIFPAEAENKDPKCRKLDQKRYGNTSRVVRNPDMKKKREQDSINNPTASREVSPVNSLPISPKTNSGQKSLRKKGSVKYTYDEDDDEKEEEENWEYSGSDCDTDKEWKPDDKPPSPSAEDFEPSDDESINSVEQASSPLRTHDGGLLGIAPDEDSANNSDFETPKQTTRERRSEMQYKRNSGEAYTSSTGKNIAARLRKPVHQCKRRKCHLVISEENAENIFCEYWEQSSHDKRVNYICNRIESCAVERRRPTRPGIRKTQKKEYSRKVSFKYYFDIGGVRHNVCKETFLATLGETDRFLRECAAKKKTSLSGIPPDERRGKKKPVHATKAPLRQKILDHINSYPAYVSHYCRKQTKQKYLPHTLNLKMMSEQFNAQQAADAQEAANTQETTNAEEDISEDEENADNTANAETAAALNKKVSYSTYRRIFSTLNLKFKVPASDTCSTCDTLKMKIKLTKDEEERQKLTDSHELHLRRAEAAYALKRQLKARAKEDNRVGCLIFDLEQVLPTPSVSTGVAYYLRQLNTYNLTIVDASTNITYCYMWHEGEAARGANQIASALYHHLKNEVPETVEELYLFSDCCSGQNRNSIVSSMFQVVLSVKPSLKTINHIFLIPGHTRMECDTKHSLIERQKQKTANIDVPQDWYKLVRNTSSSFKVIEMAQKFYNFESLTCKDGPLIMREKKEDGSKMYWTKTFWFKYSDPGYVEVKTSYNTSSEFDQLNMIRGTAKNRRLKKNWWMQTLERCNPVNKISQEKKNNLMTLMQYVDNAHHEFYRKLVVDGTIEEDTDPDLPSDNEDLQDIEDTD